MRHLYLLYAFLCACYCPTYTATPYPYHHATVERAAAIAIFTTCNEAGEIKVRGGSGVIVGATHAVTAAHVVTCLTGQLPIEIRVQTANGKHKKAKIVKRALYADIAKLELIHGRFTAPTVVFGIRPKADEIVCVATAMPLRNRDCVIVHHVSSKGEIRTAFVADFGNSGSGVWNSKGQLVGILTKVIRGLSGQHYGSVVDVRLEDM